MYTSSLHFVIETAFLAFWKLFNRLDIMKLYGVKAINLNNYIFFRYF